MVQVETRTGHTALLSEAKLAELIATAKGGHIYGTDDGMRVCWMHDMVIYPDELGCASR